MNKNQQQDFTVIGPDFHPPFDIRGGTIHKYVRGTSPWHRDQFPEAFKDYAPEQGTTPSNGWEAEDWCGNVIEFFPDGMKWPRCK